MLVKATIADPQNVASSLWFILVYTIEGLG